MILCIYALIPRLPNQLQILGQCLPEVALKQLSESHNQHDSYMPMYFTVVLS